MGYNRLKIVELEQNRNNLESIVTGLLKDFKVYDVYIGYSRLLTEPLRVSVFVNQEQRKPDSYTESYMGLSIGYRY